jgi:molybdopterin-guanine dinucleotide biosynthesis protein A
MGRDKALLAVDGRALARIATDALVEAGATGVRCIGGDADALRALGLEVVADRHPGEGPLGGLISAFADADVPADEPVMVLTCDLPRVDATVVTVVVTALLGDRDADVAALVVAGRPQLLTAAYRPDRVLPVARPAFTAGARAVRAGLTGLRITEVTGIDPDLIEDADTPDDLHRRIRRGPSRVDLPGDGQG